MYSKDTQEAKLVIGTGERLRWAMQAWAEVNPQLTLHGIDVGQDAHYDFDLQALINKIAELSTLSNCSAFVDWGPQFLNFRRLELMSELKSRGFKLPALVSPRAIIAPNATISENCCIGAGSVVGSGCKLNYNSFIGAGCILAANVHIGSSVWLADGVQIGSGCRIGHHATLGPKVLLSDGISVGRQSVIDIPGQYRKPIPEKMLISPSYSSPVIVIDRSTVRGTFINTKFKHE
jgi:carbonic anhydrase/acetyltransferase-like protein (isoleucine patch superfamily)